jgi:hypothetical protein
MDPVLHSQQVILWAARILASSLLFVFVSLRTRQSRSRRDTALRAGQELCVPAQFGLDPRMVSTVIAITISRDTWYGINLPLVV